MIKYWKETLQIIWHAFVQENPKWSEITVDELYERLESEPPALLVDVRSIEDFNGGYGHLPGAKLIPMLELESRLDELEEYKTHEIVTMCPGGGLSLVAVDILSEAGFKNVKSLKGGTDMWHQKGYPTMFN
jgi:rhodanese-related sulfurtransferase